MRRKMFGHLPSKRIGMWDLCDFMGPRNRNAFRPYVKAARRAEARDAMREAAVDVATANEWDGCSPGCGCESALHDGD